MEQQHHTPGHYQDDLFRQSKQRLCPLYGEREAEAIVRWVLEEAFELSWADVLVGKYNDFSVNDRLKHEKIMQQLLTGMPVQYVLGTTTFCQRRFHVGPGVLIPRPETEELCHWVLTTHATTSLSATPRPADRVRILDIGTGSGCIAVTLKAARPQAYVEGWDLSPEALAQATRNAGQAGVEVCFRQQDILVGQQHLPHPEPAWDIIVSNPPYILPHEKAGMQSNVLDFEPHEALFVPEDDPLLFYRHIGCYAQQCLKPGGWLFLEINSLMADPMRQLLDALGFTDTETRADQQGRPRMMRTRKSNEETPRP